MEFMEYVKEPNIQYRFGNKKENRYGYDYNIN